MRTAPSSPLKALVLGALLAACGGAVDDQATLDPGATDPIDQADGSLPDADADADADAGTDGGEQQGPGWVTLYAESFQSGEVGSADWQPDSLPDDGPFSDDGLFFQPYSVVPPQAWRISKPFGQADWLTIESYTRDSSAPFSRFAAIAVDPADSSNRVLRIGSEQHTDATVVRPSAPLPERYRVSLRVGYPRFGDGLAGLNGYDGGELSEPWGTASATSQNGFYWLTILDSQPRPHNNVWIHHHRKVVIDSDNHYPAWMEIWDGSRFVSSGENPIMLFALDGRGQADQTSGKPFLSYSAGSWQPSGAIRAVDSYLPGEWYDVSIERSGNTFTMELSGRFRYGGQRTYRATIDAAAKCVYHYNRPGEPAATQCADSSYFPSLGPDYPSWAADGSWPDYFMFGDPHNNYYEGEVLYDDVKLEVWRE